VVDPPDASVTVDGTIVADLDALALRDGATVVVRKPGFVTVTAKVDATHPLPAKIVLRPAKKAGQGFLQVFASDVDWAEVTVDGRKVGATPTRKLALTEGPHQVVVTCTEACASKQVLLRRRVAIAPGETTVVRAE
jgi:PEGA domain-containing protein